MTGVLQCAGNRGREIAPELVRRAQAGDEEAFNQLYEQTGAAIYRTIFSMVQNEATAWDIHQNTYLLANTQGRSF